VTCEFCGEDITFDDEPAAMLGVMDADGAARQGFVHRQCSLREVMGGIGHLIAHDYWCLQKHDPDGGLTTRQSSLLVWEYYRVVGMPPL
jgi:hypothetical protein